MLWIVFVCSYHSIEIYTICIKANSSARPLCKSLNGSCPDVILSSETRYWSVPRCPEMRYAGSGDEEARGMTISPEL